MEIKIYREVNVKVITTPGRLYRWAYTYTVDGGGLRQYGTGLTSLKSMIKQRFPGAKVTETWK